MPKCTCSISCVTSSYPMTKVFFKVTESLFSLQMDCMVQVLGQPDDNLLNRALYSQRFSKLVYRPGRFTWELLVE